MKKILFLLFFLFSACQNFKFADIDFLTRKNSYIPPTSFKLENRLRQTNPNNKADNFAILIGANTELNHKGNLSMAYQSFLERGYKKENIFILDSDGESPFFPSDGFSGLNSISLLLNSFQNIVENNDTLFVYITGHGGRKDNKSFIILNSSEGLYYNKFFDALKKINPKHGIIFNDICFAEIEIINDLCEYIFLTATDKNNTSYGNGFPRTFWDAFRNAENASVPDIFTETMRNDPGTKKGLNRPQMIFGCE